MHDSVNVGTVFSDWKVTNAFRFNENASRYIFVAGGIGITPIIAMIARARALKRPFELHYCARSPAQAAFLNHLTHSDFGEQVFLHYSQHQKQRWKAADAIGERSPGEEIYCCGPATLMDAIRISTVAWPEGTVHFEFFSASESLLGSDNAGFSVEIASSGKIYDIPPDKTILHVLREHGHNVDSSCEAGACGTCRIGYLSGVPDHKDLYLTDDERKESIMVCVSRSKSDRLLLDL